VRRPDGRLSYRVLIAAIVPILLMVLANLGRTDAAARDVTTRGAVRRGAAGASPRAVVPEVRLEQLCLTQQIGEPLSFRNPFAFAASSVPPRPQPSPVAIASAPEAPLDIPSSIAFSLIGVATSIRADGRAERTAIIAGPGDMLYLVREADAVTTRYRVDVVLPDGVLLVDGATGASLRLSLR
jgi:hypothetical protein